MANYTNIKERGLGVHFIKKTNKYIVRVMNKKNSTITTIAQFKKEQDAVKCFEDWKKENWS